MDRKKMQEYWLKPHKRNNTYYRTIRFMIGLLGALLPTFCALGALFIMGTPVLETLSSYYYTNMRDVFTGIVVLESFFLVVYKGWSRLDNWVSTAIGIAGAGVALFPNMCLVFPCLHVGTFHIASNIGGYVHLVCAAVFFFILSVNSFCLFSRSNDGKTDDGKQGRNIVYQVSGVVIFIALVCMIVLSFALNVPQKKDSKILFILECVALAAFSVSWIVKALAPSGDGKKRAPKAGPRTAARGAR